MLWPIMYWNGDYRELHSDGALNHVRFGAAMHLTSCMAESTLNKLYWCKQIEIKE
jgi:hypothetical protein